jgi:signal transduction histidine kinase
MDIKTSDKSFWDTLYGGAREVTMENRAFNVVSVITLMVLAFCLFFDFFIGQWAMSLIIIGLQIVQSVLYYNSRVKRVYKSGLFIYAGCSYVALIANYHFNAGLSGPTLLIFMLTFQLLIATSPQPLYKVWIALHLLIAGVLLALEFNLPAFVPETYQTPLHRFLDVYWTYAAAMLFTFFTTNYLRKFYIHEKQLAAERLVEITGQNEQIRRQNDLLERHNDEKTKLFSIVSHDLRGPIDSIRGYLEILSEHILTEQERKELENELLAQTKYTSDLLLNLLYWSKTQMQGVAANMAVVKVVELIDDARNMHIANAAKKGIKITYSIDNELEVVADKEMLRIVLRNLINNAVKFTMPDGEVAIKVIREGNKGIISIKDNGIGIPASQQTEIFTLKSRSTFGTSHEKGVGLGLLLCKEFVDYQKGEIWFESTEGKGSVFYIKLPVALY